MKSIAQGAKKNAGKTWFSQLSDKSEFSMYMYLDECQLSRCYKILESCREKHQNIIVLGNEKLWW